MTSTNDIRRSFLDYFGREGHQTVPSAPLVPHNDPTLMFVNAGMVPFKNVFTGLETRPYVTATSSQKCVRAGGKHNDLDNVGYTARHHTFFEMLGNFSFGAYFKEQAITHAWTLLTREWGIPAEKLTVTVYHTDDEAFDLWKRIAGLPDDRIIRIPTSDNFWSMGDTGPCGPCSEIFYDHGDHIPGGPPGSPRRGRRPLRRDLEPRVHAVRAGRCRDAASLPRPSIDTGMGLERIAAVLQGVHDNYDTDTFKALIAASGELTKTPTDGANTASHRVIADHLRASGFLVADGVLPANEGRGYVLRRIMRRAMRHAHLLGAADPLMWRLVPALVAEMGVAYPELVRAQPLIEETLKLEETRFRQTLANGLRLLDEATATMAEGATLPGATAFKLYDTFGFPYDLTEDALRGQGMAVDRAGFDAAMAEQKAAARAAWKGSGDKASDDIWFDIAEEHGGTEFTGYGATEGEGRVVAIVRDGERVKAAQTGDEVTILTNQSPFYGESGGQVGDVGIITGDAGFEAEVTDTAKPLGRLHAHKAVIEGGEVNVGDAVHLKVDVEHRNEVRANHSATHLMHAALRNTLGKHVSQKGSLVAAERLRFDFSHQKAMTPQEIALGRGRGEPAHPRERPRRHAADDPRRRDRGRRDGAVRREIWRRGARAVDGARGRGQLFDRAVRRHARHCAGRHRLVQDRRRERGVVGHPPHRGADRRGGADLADGARGSAQGGGAGAEGVAGGGAGADRRAGRGAAPARARACRGEEGACTGWRRSGHGRTGGRAGRRAWLRRPGARRLRSQGTARAGRRRQDADRLGRRGDARDQRGARVGRGRRDPTICCRA